ncbi:MAG TPA: ribonuclease P protein component [Acidimicrobiales bacterium]|nr:ribonuclease P protein component [Acidimicrobiales bacterium]
MPIVGKIRERATFRALRRPDGRSVHGPLRVAYVPPRGPDAAFPQVAYAVGRRCGNAVVRNRLRRRLRAAVAETAPDLVPGAYLVTCGPEAADLGWPELAAGLRAALLAAASPRMAVAP